MYTQGIFIEFIYRVIEFIIKYHNICKGTNYNHMIIFMVHL